jgi:hypothetical protein
MAKDMATASNGTVAVVNIKRQTLNRQDFSDRGADQKSLLDGALRRGSGEREAWIGV